MFVRRSWQHTDGRPWKRQADREIGDKLERQSHIRIGCALRRQPQKHTKSLSHSIVAPRYCFCACYNCRHRNLTMKSKRKFTVVIERDEEGYYVASVPALRGCHTQAKTLDTLMKRVREVIELCIEDGDEVDDSLELVGIQQISL